MKKGKFVVIDGTDASGKATQLKLLEKRLKQENFSIRTLDFPRYYRTAWGEFIGRYQMGEFGDPQRINPYLSFIPYMLDQLMAKSTIVKWVEQGKIVLSNRYFTSNFAHQAGKLPPRKRKKFREFLKRTGYEELGLYRPDLVLVLYVPYKIARKLNLKKGPRRYTKGRKRDLVERHTTYQKEAEREFLKVCKEEEDWVLIRSCDRKGRLKSPQEINEIIYKTLRERKII